MINRKIKFNDVRFRLNGQQRKEVYYGTWSTGAIMDDLVSKLGQIIQIDGIETYEKKYEVTEQKFIEIAKEIKE